MELDCSRRTMMGAIMVGAIMMGAHGVARHGVAIEEVKRLGLPAGGMGFCGATQDNSGSCRTSDKGHVSLQRIWPAKNEQPLLESCQEGLFFWDRATAGWDEREQSRACWRTAVRVCMQRCLKCDRCRFISVSLKYGDCSWFSSCSLDHLSTVTAWTTSASFVTAQVAPAQNALCPRSQHSARKGALAARPRVETTPMQLPGLRCDERYMSLVQCGGRSFLFARRDERPPPNKPNQWTTVLHTLSPRPSHYPVTPNVTLPAELNMSHNAAVLCLRGRLVAFGGQGYADSTDEVGVVRREADPSRVPLRWSRPQLVASGNPNVSQCIETRCVSVWRKVLNGGTCPIPPPFQGSPLLGNAQRPPSSSSDPRNGLGPTAMDRFTCEFDGKLSVVAWKGALWMFSRSNLYRSGGGRHVQVASRLLGREQHTAVAAALGEGAALAGPPELFGAFQQLEFEGYTPKKENNIYYMTVRRLSQRSHLLGLFPAILEGLGGVWCSTSSDGVHWARPLRVWESAVVTGERTSDHPVESSNLPEIGVLIEHNVHISLGGPDYFDTLCVNVSLPRLCSYRFPAAAAVPAEKICAHMASAVQEREQQALEQWKRTRTFGS